MKNGGALAFRFVEEEEKVEDEDEDEMEVDGGKWKGQWDVVIPTFEDDLGEEAEGDVGVRKEFKG